MIDFPDFGKVGAPETMHQRLIEQEQARIEAAKDILLARADLAVVHPVTGRRLNERKWREHVQFIEGL